MKDVYLKCPKCGMDSTAEIFYPAAWKCLADDLYKVECNNCGAYTRPHLTLRSAVMDFNTGNVHGSCLG